MTNLTPIIQAWDVGEITDTQEVATGVLSTNWFVGTTTGRYFLKQYRFPLRERVAEIHASKHHFAQSGIPVILPLAQPSGDTICTHEGRHYALFPRIAAIEKHRDNLSDTTIVSMGRLLGKFHRTGKGNPVVIEHDLFREWSEEQVAKIATYRAQIAKIENPTPFDTLALQDLETKQRLIAQNQTPYASLGMQHDHLLHGDFLEHNLFFNEQDEVSHVFDFEKTQYGPRSFELLRTLFLSILNGKYDAAAIHKGRLFLSAYQTEYPISHEELRAGLEVFFLKSIHNTWIQKECYTLNNRRPEHFLAIEMERITYLAEHRDALFAALAETP